jgi:hypothetical protein
MKKYPFFNNLIRKVSTFIAWNRKDWILLGCLLDFDYKVTFFFCIFAALGILGF